MDQQILDVQRALGVAVDGAPGPKTWEAIHRRIVGVQAPAVPSPAPVPVVTPSGPWDERTRRCIESLLPEVRPHAAALLAEGRKRGIDVRIISGTRTYAEQDAIYAKAHDGQDNDGDGRVDEADECVTKARGGFSNHNFGVAFDVGIFEGGEYLGDLVRKGRITEAVSSRQYGAIGAIGMGLGLEWGGSWTGFVDEPHFQYRPRWARGMSQSSMLAEFRRRVAAGTPLFP